MKCRSKKSLLLLGMMFEGCMQRRDTALNTVKRLSTESDSIVRLSEIFTNKWDSACAFDNGQGIEEINNVTGLDYSLYWRDVGFQFVFMEHGRISGNHVFDLNPDISQGDVVIFHFPDNAKNYHCFSSSQDSIIVKSVSKGRFSIFHFYL